MTNFSKIGCYLATLFFVSLIGCGENNVTSRVFDGYVKQLSDPPTYVRVPQKLLTEEFIKDSGFNRDSKRDDVYAFGYISRDLLVRLPKDVVDQIVELDETLLRHHRFDAKTLEVFLDEELSGKEMAFEDYHNYDALKAELEKLQRDYPSLVKLDSAGKSGKGRELFYIKISDHVEIDEAEPNLLFIGNMHGDETVGRELMIYLARLLLSEYSTNSRMKNLVDNAQIYMMPSMNPDGFESRTRYNAAGADLNRSFPDFSSDSSDTPLGRAAEVKAIMELHTKQYFHLAMNFHGGAVVLNLSWDTKQNSPDSEKFEDDPAISPIARKYADNNPTMINESGGSFDRGVTYGYEWYPVNGGMQDWASYFRKSIHIVAELSEVKWPSAQNLPKYWNENRESMLLYLEYGLLGIHLELVDGKGEPVTGAAIGVSSSGREIVFSKNQVHRITPAGTHTVKVSAPTFEPVEFKLTAESFRGTYHKVVLKKRSF